MVEKIQGGLRNFRVGVKTFWGVGDGLINFRGFDKFSGGGGCETFERAAEKFLRGGVKKFSGGGG